MPIILKFGSLKLLEGEGPVQRLLHLYTHTLRVWYRDFSTNSSSTACVIYEHTLLRARNCSSLIAHSCSVVMRCGLILSEEEMSEASGHVRNHKKNYCISKLNQAVTEACRPILISTPDSFHISRTFFSCGAWTRFRVMASPYGTSWSHSDTPHWLGLLWTSDQLDAEASTWQHTTHIRDTERERDIHAPTGFEPTIPASERPQTHALDRVATGIGWSYFTRLLNCINMDLLLETETVISIALFK